MYVPFVEGPAFSLLRFGFGTLAFWVFDISLSNLVIWWLQGDQSTGCPEFGGTLASPASGTGAVSVRRY